jgi:hypothetical protein
VEKNVEKKGKKNGNMLKRFKKMWKEEKEQGIIGVLRKR